MNYDEAVKNVGGLSVTSKMPCPSWSIPARLCKTGSLLAKNERSVCHTCYAQKGFYRMGNTKAAMERRYLAWKSNRELWVESMVEIMKRHDYFRWLDSGDIQGTEMLSDIISVAKQSSGTKFWAPTKEYALVKTITELPENLVIRVSAPFIGMVLTSNLPTSSVVTADYNCKAYDQGGKCLECRDCWDKSIKNIAYKLH